MFTDITGEDIFAVDEITINSVTVDSRQFFLKNPVVHKSESVYWNGIYVTPQDYILVGQLIRFPTLPIQIDDQIYVKYAILED